MLELLIPPLSTHLYAFLTKKYFSKSIFFDLWIISLIALSHGICLIPRCLIIGIWILFSLFQLTRWYCQFKFHTPLSFDLLRVLKNPHSFFDSAKELQIPRTCIIGCGLISLSLLAFTHRPYFPFWIALFILSGIASLFTIKIKIKKPSEKPQFSFPHETYSFLSPEYPALRKTLAFLGEKKIDIPLLPSEKPHIIFIFLESFRAKNIGSLQMNKMHPSAAPSFDAWAQKGQLFRNCHVNGLQTFRAFLSAFFGIPGHIPTNSLKPFCSLPLVGLPQILKNYGYHPAIIQSGDISFDHLHPFFLSHGFETILGAEQIPSTNKNSWGIEDESMMRFAANWISQQSFPSFLSLFTITNHHPWKAPDSFLTSLDPTLPPLYQQFLRTFAYTDHCLGVFLETLKTKRLLEKSILFIMGDHGQEMEDRGEFTPYNRSLYEENIHVPLLILAEGRNIPPASHDSACSLLDLVPTVLDLFNFQDPHHSLGRSLLRETSSPVYFSLFRNKEVLGTLEGKTKGLFSENKIIGFNLEKDPEEKCNIPNLLSPEKTFLFFDAVKQLYKTHSWAPPSMQAPLNTISATSNMTPNEWLKLIHQHPCAGIIDLSASSKLTDRAILEIDPKRAKYWSQLNLTNCTLLTDRSLEWIAKNCPHLISIDLSHCHLITDHGIEMLLSHCPLLRHLFLNGLDDLSLIYQSEQNLHTWSLQDRFHLTEQSFLHFFKQSPSLKTWEASLYSISNEALLQIRHIQKVCHSMAISQGRQIHDNGLFSLFSAQQNLASIILEDFPHLKNPDFSQLRYLQFLTLSDCPQLENSVLESLEQLPIASLRIKNCPQITPEAIEKIKNKKNIKIIEERIF